MNYTSNHHLPQWASSDRVRMEDFNNAMANIESSLTSNAQAAASAQSAAEEAKAAAAGSSKPYVTGTYTGGDGVQTVSLGFRPSFLIISGIQPTNSPDAAHFVITAGSSSLYNRLRFYSSGFILYPDTFDGYQYPEVNAPGRTYEYIAFK